MKGADAIYVRDKMKEEGTEYFLRHYIVPSDIEDSEIEDAACYAIRALVVFEELVKQKAAELERISDDKA